MSPPACQARPRAQFRRVDARALKPLRGNLYIVVVVSDNKGDAPGAVAGFRGGGSARVRGAQGNVYIGLTFTIFKCEDSSTHCEQVLKTRAQSKSKSRAETETQTDDENLSSLGKFRTVPTTRESGCPPMLGPWERATAGAAPAPDGRRRLRVHENPTQKCLYRYTL